MHPQRVQHGRAGLSGCGGKRHLCGPHGSGPGLGGQHQGSRQGDGHGFWRARTGLRQGWGSHALRGRRGRQLQAQDGDTRQGLQLPHSRGLRGGRNGFKRLRRQRCACGLPDGGDTFRQQGRHLHALGQQGRHLHALRQKAWHLCALGHGRYFAEETCYGLVVQALGFGEGEQALDVWNRRVAGDDIDGLPQGHHLQANQPVLRRGKPLPLQFQHVPGEELSKTASRATVGPSGRGFCVSQSSPD